VSQLAVPQDSSLFRSLYGEPEFERFVVRSGIGLTVESGADGLACKMSIKPLESPFVLRSRLLPPAMSPQESAANPLPGRQMMSQETVLKILDEVLGPPLMRNQAWCSTWDSRPSYVAVSIAFVTGGCPAQVWSVEVKFQPGHCPNASEKSAELRSRYGRPDADNFRARPGIALLVEYGSDGEACEIQIDPGATPLSFKTAKEILDEAIPPITRGISVNGGDTRAGCGAFGFEEYESVTFSYSGSVCPEHVDSAGATFKRAACQNLPQ
jgi:hypothetical protein